MYIELLKPLGVRNGCSTIWNGLPDTHVRVEL